ncbi:hypothetical protein V5G24_20065 [Xanthobacter sp. VTT E-85241]|uniref:hypothetical protein n=1 Tax=Roseixanthobacter finlandensis TaxID=3119922 RepID=UPI00372BF94A
MTDEEIKRFGADIATAIRSRGQVLADAARAQGLGPGGDMLAAMFEQAAQVAELRTQVARMSNTETGRSNAGRAVR